MHTMLQAGLVSLIEALVASYDGYRILKYV